MRLNVNACNRNKRRVKNKLVANVNVMNTNGNIEKNKIVVNMNVKNPTTQEAALSVLDWILAIDGTDMASGTNNQKYTIKPSTTTTVPLGVSTDLGDLFSKKGLDALKNFASSFSSDGTSSKMGLRVKPSLTVGSSVIPFPNYIALEKKTGTTSAK